MQSGHGSVTLTRKQREKQKTRRKQHRKEKLEQLLEHIDADKVEKEIAVLERSAYLAPNQKERLRDLRRIRDEHAKRVEAEAARVREEQEQQANAAAAAQQNVGSSDQPSRQRRRYELTGASSSDDDGDGGGGGADESSSGSDSDGEMGSGGFLGLLHGDASIRRAAPATAAAAASAGGAGAWATALAAERSSGSRAITAERGSVLEDVKVGSSGSSTLAFGFMGAAGSSSSRGGGGGGGALQRGGAAASAALPAAAAAATQPPLGSGKKSGSVALQPRQLMLKRKSVVHTPAPTAMTAAAVEAHTTSETAADQEATQDTNYSANVRGAEAKRSEPQSLPVPAPSSAIASIPDDEFDEILDSL